MTIKQVARAAVVAAIAALLPIAAAATVHATTINCVHTGPVMNHPGMEYICYVHHDDKSMETFFAPGPHP
jgi:hypothetical protein